jgi:hypothetical protein
MQAPNLNVRIVRRRAPSWVPLPVWFIRVVRPSQNYRLDPFRLLSSPEYRLCD